MACRPRKRKRSTPTSWLSFRLKRAERTMTRSSSSLIVIVAASLAVLGGMALAAQDRYTLQVPNGLAFSDFRGYETWQPVAVSQTEHGIKVIAANAAMIE